MILAQVIKELTPRKLLKKTEFDRPLIISPLEFKSFDDLYKYRKEISELRLVPVKDDAMYHHYHTFDRVKLAQDIKEQLHKEFVEWRNQALLLPNQFPDWLPEDVNQRVLWIKDRCSNEKALRILMHHLHNERISRYIIFERPLGTKTKLVKGSIPQIRHIHLWTKKK